MTNESIGRRDEGFIGPVAGSVQEPDRGVARRRSGTTNPWRRLGRSLRQEDGSATAEYAIATMAAVGFAGLLVVILKGDEVRGILTDLVRSALTAAS